LYAQSRRNSTPGFVTDFCEDWEGSILDLTGSNSHHMIIGWYALTMQRTLQNRMQKWFGSIGEQRGAVAIFWD
jgi:hypothetical protein